MALEFSFIPTSAGTTPAATTLDAIPDDVKTDVEEVYNYLKNHPDGRMRTPAFVDADGNADVAAAKRWFAQAQAYCRLRPAELGGELRIRKSPTRGLPDNIIDFRVSDMPKPDANAQAINNAVTAVKAAAATPQPPAKATRK